MDVSRSLQLRPSPSAWWAAYAFLSRGREICRGTYRRIDPEFSATGVKQGVLADANMIAFASSLSEAQATAIVQEDFVRGYTYHPALHAFQRDLNIGHTWVTLGKTQQERLTPLLKALAEPVAQCLGWPWRVVNVRCWRTRPRAQEIGANSWHTDGFPTSVLKIMIYPNGASSDVGTTELVLKSGSTLTLQGPPGLWLLFKNSELLHRGVAPKTGERLGVEVTIAPSFRHDQRPVCAGLNALYPKNPFIWLRA